MIVGVALGAQGVGTYEFPNDLAVPGNLEDTTGVTRCDEDVSVRERLLDTLGCREEAHRFVSPHDLVGAGIDLQDRAPLPTRPVVEQDDVSGVHESVGNHHGFVLTVESLGKTPDDLLRLLVDHEDHVKVARADEDVAGAEACVSSACDAVVHQFADRVEVGDFHFSPPHEPLHGLAHVLARTPSPDLAALAVDFDDVVGLAVESLDDEHRVPALHPDHVVVDEDPVQSVLPDHVAIPVVLDQ